MPKKPTIHTRQNTKIKSVPHADALKFVHKLIEKWPWMRFVLPIYNRKWLIATALFAFFIFLSGILLLSLGNIAVLNEDSKNAPAQVTKALHFSSLVPASAYGLDVVVITFGLCSWLGSLFMLAWHFDFFGWFKIPKINKHSFFAVLTFNVLYFVSCLLLLIILIVIIFTVLTTKTWGHAIYHLY